MTETILQRRQLLKLAGAGMFFGTYGAGTAAAGGGRYIVGTATRAATREARRRARSVHRVLDFGPIGRVVAGTYTRESLRELARRPDVRYVEPDGFMYAIAGTGDIDSGDDEVPWGVDRVDAEKVHGSSTGTGADVSIIDTGIDNDHPDLADNLGGGISFTVGPWWRDDSSTYPKDWDDGNGHGTYCAGIAAAVDNGAGVVGVSPGATLHAVKVLDNSGSGSWSDVAAGIEWTADQGYDVGSLSLGGGHSETVEDACAYASGKGVLLVAAAGNDGEGTADDHYPAAYATVVSVGATERDDDIASFSSTGETVELGAPGRSIYSTYKGGGYKTLSGTSMACPHVSGAGALRMAAGDDNATARTVLGDTAEWPVYGSDGVQLTAEKIGNGLLDVEAAVGGSSGGGDVTAPTIDGATATDDTDGDGTVGDGDQVTVSAGVSDASGVGSVTADASDFGASSTLGMTDGDGDGIYTATFTVDAAGASADGDYPITVTATDGEGNAGTADTNALTLNTGSGDGGDGGSVAIEEFTATSLSPRNPHAEVEMTWQVSGTPEDVTLELTDGSTVHTWSAVGTSGTQTHTEKHTSPKDFTATLTVMAGTTIVTESRTLTA